MTEQPEREATPGEPLPEVDPGAYPPDAVPLAEDELTADDLKGADIHRDDLGGQAS